jgi:uncharacterized repeat protein (TIGR03803 family)
MLAGCAARDNTSVLPGAMPQGTGAHADASSYKLLYLFKGGSYGRWPDADLISVNGTLYGTAGGGSANKGIVYSVTTAGVQKILHKFTGGSDGASPQSGLIDVNGTLYGTTYAGGHTRNHRGQGTVYSVSTTGAEKVLHVFDGGSDGANPEAGLVELDGTLYGTTARGGGGTCLTQGRERGCGTIYSITTTGTEKVLGTFSDESEGEFPQAGLVAMHGALYGTTYQGGTDAEGTVFRITTAGVKSVLYNFGAGSDGRNPRAALIDVKGTLYGTTLSGGDSDKGMVFSMSTSGAEAVLHNFSGIPDGANPQARLIDVNGTLYGTTENGGATSKSEGAVYSISTTGAEKVLYGFTGRGHGNYPVAGVIDVNGTLYGTTLYGGRAEFGAGTVYALSP